MELVKYSGWENLVREEVASEAEEAILRGRDPRQERRRRQVQRRRFGAGLVSGILVAAALLLALFLTGCGTGDEVGDAGPVTPVDPAVSEPVEQTTSTTTTTSESGGAGPSPSPTTSTTKASTEQTQVSVYFVRGEKIGVAHRSIPKTTAVGAAAMRALLEGPNSREREAGLISAIPQGTAFLGLNIKDKVATVDLSQEFASGGGTLSMTLRLAQVVYTLTQFPSVDRVQFRLDGQPVEAIGGEGLVVYPPVSRRDYEDATPAIMVESPAVGDSIKSPVRIWGTANTFEATFQVNIVDADGRVIADQFVTATSGSGDRGTFDVKVPFSISRSQRGALIVFEYSAKDGSKINIVEIPLGLER